MSSTLFINVSVSAAGTGSNLDRADTTLDQNLGIKKAEV